MKILIVSKYFWPDTPPYALILYKIALKLAVNDFQVKVLTTQPSYQNAAFLEKTPTTEHHQGLLINRLLQFSEKRRWIILRIVNSVLFSIVVFFKIVFGERHDIIMTVTTPPVIISGIVRLAAGLRSIPYVYHCQDIYPEIVINNGNMSNGLVGKFLKYWDTNTMSNAKAIVVLSEDMKRTIDERGVSSMDKVKVIHNFIHVDDKKAIDSTAISILKETDSFKVIFCGNFGYLQNLGKVIEAAHLLEENETIKFVFIGDGVDKTNLISKAGKLLNRTVHFIDFQPADIAFEAMKLSDLGIVSIAPNVHKTAYPTKTIMYLAAGLKSLVIVDSKSDLSTFIRSNDCGYSVEPNDVIGIKESIEKAFESWKIEAYPKDRIINIAKKKFGEDVILQEWVDLFKSCTNK